MEGSSLSLKKQHIFLLLPHLWEIKNEKFPRGFIIRYMPSQVSLRSSQKTVEFTLFMTVLVSLILGKSFAFLFWEQNWVWILSLFQTSNMLPTQTNNMIRTGRKASSIQFLAVQFLPSTCPQVVATIFRHKNFSKHKTTRLGRDFCSRGTIETFFKRTDSYWKADIC